MGVHGLWELLSPVGRRVSVETLAGKTLAVDASIWMVQFMKAMRDEKGEMVRNAHLLGFFRRICKLLFLRTKPVFVFDGGTPALKRRTVIARRRQRENAQAKVRKTAEKMLLNHLKTLRLKELADDIKSQRMQKNSNTKGQNVSKEKDFVGSDSRGSHVKELDEMSAAKFATKEDINSSQATLSSSYNQEELDEMLAASIAAEESGKHARKGVPSIIINPSEEEHGAEEQILLLLWLYLYFFPPQPSVNAEVDIAVLAALPQSMQLDILAQLKGKKKEGLLKEVYNHEQHDVDYQGKGKGILLSEAGMVGCSSRHDTIAPRTDNQDSIDEMLAASIALEENEKLVNNASTSVGASTIEEDEVDYDEDEEMILPAMHGEVDPLVLASLPPSMQLDLLVQMRERLIAENRHKYQKVKKDPAKFSELQIQAYLKTVAFRREINEVQKAAAGGGVEGVQTSRIASEANREYIFSSSFTGDKHELTSTGLEKNKSTKQKAQGTHYSQNLANSILAGNDFNKSSELVCNEPGEPADENIQTYIDDRGQFRVSRLRAMGMRMTRDIQRNLDLMKEFEQESAQVNKASNIGTIKNGENKGSSESSGIQPVGKSQEVNVDLVGENVQNEQIMLDQNASIDISFEYGCENEFANGEDDIFSSLVGGNPLAIFGTDDSAATVQPSHSDWEEGIVEGKSTVCPKQDKVELKSSVADDDNNNESEVEWEEGDCDGANSSLLSGKYASQGQLEEESNLQEAIRRSLESAGDGKHKYKAETLIDTTCRWDSHPCSEDSISDTNIMTKDQVPVVEKKLSDEHDNDKVSSYHKNTPKAVPVGATEEEKKNYIKEPEPFSNCTDTTKPTIHLGESSLKGVTEELIEPNLASEGNNGIFFDKRNSSHGSDTVNSPGDFPALATQVRLEKEIHILGQEYINLENEQRKLERNAESVNSELFTECQELLQMFGLPYIIAPMEAEAQCAYLELEKLVDGVVTDDSDVLLFGARSVYKNIFDDRKYVETYFMEDIEKELGLTREKLIRMALLLGSDYTEGVSGIGIVNAIEVLNAFPEEDGLLKFRKWVESPDPTILGRLDAKSGSNSRKKGSKVEEKINSLNCDAKESPSEQNLPHALEQNKLPDYIQETKQTFFNKHRNVSKNWHIPSSFPSETVISAYCSPHVDKSTEPFTWGKPDHLVLRKLCWEKFGWIGQKADELLLPVLKEYNKRETQLRLEAFYSFNERFAKIRSKRIKKAVKGITGKLPSDMIDDSAEVLSKSRKIGREPEDSTLEISGGTDKRLERQRKSKIKQSTKRKNDTVAKEQSKKKKDNDDPSSAPGTSEMENLQPSMQTEEQCDGKALIQNTSGRGRHRGMGIKRGRDNENLSSSASSDIDDQGSRVHVDKFSEHVRKSLRSRKPVNYSFEDPEDEDADDAFDRSNRTGPIEEKLSQIHGASEDGPTDFSAMNFPLRENSPTDPFKSEGPFCVHAGEINHPSTGNHDSSTGNHDSSDDYLKMGGGFCLDDGETDKLDTIDDVNTATVDSTQDFSHFSDCLDETNRDKNSSDILFSGTEKPENGSEGGVDFYDFGIKRNDLVNTSSYDHSDVGILKPENVHNNSGASAGVFSAMPFLRKRRKK
ncbi:DNA repair protein UVH3 isoform X8 [Vigna angularis]|uniref:DNA repair protein UVH3 isoform X8 n=1 Tax=Phaseolus angularis TaxID=3914 RepID=UPI0022B5C659|nr:DNA repair protein UVH3 isoform X8 [Vigna angularis]